MKVPKKLKRTDRVIAMYEAVHKIDEIIDYLAAESTEAEPEILPCPWPSCQSSDVKVVEVLGRHYVCCNSCKSSAPFHNAKEAAIKEWNEVKR